MQTTKVLAKKNELHTKSADFANPAPVNAKAVMTPAIGDTSRHNIVLGIIIAIA